MTVNIFGQKYTLKGHGSQEHIEQVAQYVDLKMNDLSEKNPSLDLNKTAVLTAINIADEYFKLQEEYDELLKLLEEHTNK